MCVKISLKISKNQIKALDFLVCKKKIVLSIGIYLPMHETKQNRDIKSIDNNY